MSGFGFLLNLEYRESNYPAGLVVVLLRLLLLKLVLRTRARSPPSRSHFISKKRTVGYTEYRGLEQRQRKKEREREKEENN